MAMIGLHYDPGKKWKNVTDQGFYLKFHFFDFQFPTNSLFQEI